MYPRRSSSSSLGFAAARLTGSALIWAVATGLLLESGLNHRLIGWRRGRARPRSLPQKALLLEENVWPGQWHRRLSARALSAHRARGPGLSTNSAGPPAHDGRPRF